ncbi:DUF4401 domain-containing protein [Sphingobacterium sp. BN32]|uniref:DUF4401 domain-containing protein n=1 Tax=Sphingobacterium sp. BN32 TaxID=3058432 RepID=UPI00265D5C1B|nr:DUF4401 domain-containing protein [Sphingobacterium sp. BN32]WKK58089.1 DUF4401 domain-containing protein [Sphingobacterium sp. BN32]
MKSRLNFDELTQGLGWSDLENSFDRQAIETEFQKRDETQSLPIKILSIFGGIMASSTLSGFLFSFGILENKLAQLIFGLIFLVGAIFFSRKTKMLLMDTIAVSGLILGFILLGLGLEDYHLSDEAALLIICIVATVSLNFVRNYIMTFILVLIACGTLLASLNAADLDNLSYFYVPALGLVLAHLYIKEARIISKRNFFSIRYNPIRTALTFCLIAGLIYLTLDSNFILTNYYALCSSLSFIVLSFVALNFVFEKLAIENKRTMILLYLLCLCCLLPTIFAPAISGAIFLILISFLANYKTGFVLGILLLLYAVSRFYYDLDISLLDKSIAMMISGAFFIILYFVSLKLSRHEEN